MYRDPVHPDLLAREGRPDPRGLQLADLLQGQRLADFLLREREAGRGGGGVVWAVELLDPHMMDLGDDEAAARVDGVDCLPPPVEGSAEEVGLVWMLRNKGKGDGGEGARVFVFFLYITGDVPLPSHPAHRGRRLQSRSTRHSLGSHSILPSSPARFAADHQV